LVRQIEIVVAIVLAPILVPRMNHGMQHAHRIRLRDANLVQVIENAFHLRRIGNAK